MLHDIMLPFILKRVNYIFTR